MDFISCGRFWSNMNVAVIDMGTNTFHLLIVEVWYDDFRVIHRERQSVKIGKGGINDGKITAEAADRALNAMIHFREVMDQHIIEDVFATATSAIRSATNGKELCEAIRIKTGIEVRIISGEEEARNIYYGVRKALPIGDDPALIMDIGGGSIEFIIGSDQEIFWLKSFEIGGQRMLDMFHKNDPISSNELQSLQNYLQTNLSELFEAVKVHKPGTLIGSSGTFDTLSDIYRKKRGIAITPGSTEFPFDLDDFQIIYDEIMRSNREERLAIPGMIEMRVELIVVALELLKFVIEKCEINNLRISAYALKEGVLLKTIDSLKESNKLKPNV